MFGNIWKERRGNNSISGTGYTNIGANFMRRIVRCRYFKVDDIEISVQCHMAVMAKIQKSI